MVVSITVFPTKIQLAFKKHVLGWARDSGPVLSGHAYPTLLDSMPESGVLKPTSEYEFQIHDRLHIYGMNMFSSEIMFFQIVDCDLFVPPSFLVLSPS